MAAGSLIMRCIATESSIRARRITSRSVTISSAMQRLFKHRLEHCRVEPARILVVTAAVIAIDHPLPARQLMLCPVSELTASDGQAEASAQAVMRDLAQRDERRELRQRRDSLHQERAAGR